YGMYGYALMSCLQMRDYFLLGVKYHSLATPTLAIEWTERDDRAVWSFPDALVCNESPDIRRFLIEQQYMQHVTHLQDVFGRPRLGRDLRSLPRLRLRVRPPAVRTSL